MRAVGYERDAVRIIPRKDDDPLIVPYREHVPPDVTAEIFWLKNRRPKLWRDHHEHIAGGTIVRKGAHEVRKELIDLIIENDLQDEIIGLLHAKRIEAAGIRPKEE